MTGILLLFVVALWIVVAYVIARLIASKVPPGRWKVLVRVGAFLIVFLLPLADEIVGIFQFQHLCQQHSSIRVDRAKAAGKTVHLASTPNEEVKGTWVKIVLQPVRFLEATGGEPVMSYSGLNAYGGWLIRTLGISEGNKPLLFRGSCWPPDTDRLMKELNIKVIRR
jgi:hypothetical protein